MKNLIFGLILTLLFVGGVQVGLASDLATNDKENTEMVASYDAVTGVHATDIVYMDVSPTVYDVGINKPVHVMEAPVSGATVSPAPECSSNYWRQWYSNSYSNHYNIRHTNKSNAGLHRTKMSK